MKKRDWVVVLLPLAVTLFLDRITKIWASKIAEAKFYGLIGLVLHHNSGAILGLFSNLPEMLRIVSLSTGGAFLLFLFGILQFLLPTRSLMLRSGLSFLIGGIIGNVTDRIVWGYVVDFIILGTREHFSPAFNLADALQWVGYGCIVVAFIKEGKSLWPVENARKTYWINAKFQLKYCLALMACGLFLSIIAGTYSYTYLNVTIRELRGGDAMIAHRLLLPYVFTFAVVSLTVSAVLFLVGLILSHRAAGPLYAFERFLNDHIDGKQTRLRLRAGDEFKELERLANKLSDELSPKSWRSKSG